MASNTLKPTISVIIPYYNRENTLWRALQSVCNQTFTDYEIITVDDGSSDNSFDCVERFKSENPTLLIKNIKQSNAGPSAARNAGVKLARGMYIAFLDSDDSWHEQKLAVQYEFMKQHGDIMMTGTGHAVCVTEGDCVAHNSQSGVYQAANYQRMLFKVFFCMPTIMVHRSVFFDDNIWFREGKNHAEDLLFFLQVVDKYQAGRIEQVLAYVHKEMYGKSGLTADLKGMLKSDLDNINILMNEDSPTGRRLSRPMGYLLIGYTYVKHLKRVLISKRQ